MKKCLAVLQYLWSDDKNTLTKMRSSWILFEIDKLPLTKTVCDIAILFMQLLQFDLLLKLKFLLLKTPTVPLYWVRLTCIPKYRKVKKPFKSKLFSFYKFKKYYEIKCTDI